MIQELQKLGFNEKEVQVYLYLIEYGISPASEVSRHISIPKSTVNFIADNLWKRGILKKSFQSKTGYYEADIDMLEESVLTDALQKQNTLRDILPVLKEKSKNTISKPKITFFDGVDNCKQTYLELLKVQEVFFEFGAHEDLENAFGKDFMQEFINSRVKNKIFCDSIGTGGDVEESLQKKDAEHNRKLKVFTGNYGKIYSSITIYDNKVLILNLRWVYTGVLIENTDFAETMKAIFSICGRES